MRALSHIRKLLLNASERIELSLVLVVAFGIYILNSTLDATTHKQLVNSDLATLVNLAFQLTVLGFVLWVGRVRGWSIRQLGLNPSWLLTGMGLVVFLATVLVNIAFLAAVDFFEPSLFNHPPIRADGLSLAGIFAISIINPLFEETLVCGYIIQRLAKNGAGAAITLSAFVRFLYHTYQGPFSLAALTMGFVFGYIFWRYRQLWPLIVAHSLMDFLGLLHLAGKI
jgi:membrane protease YdiL (CAAX protease family)